MLKVGDRVFFDFDKSDLKSDAQDTLQKLAAWMTTYPNVTISLEGHCDDLGRDIGEITKTKLATLVIGSDAADAEQKVQPIRAQYGERFDPIGRREHIVPGLLQGEPQPLPQIGLVINDENGSWRLCGHGPRYRAMGFWENSTVDSACLV